MIFRSSSQGIRNKFKVTRIFEIQSRECAFERKTFQVKLDWQSSPIVDLICLADVALKIHAPNLIFASCKTECSKRNGELGTPSEISRYCFYFPGSIPV